MSDGRPTTSGSGDPGVPAPREAGSAQLAAAPSIGIGGTSAMPGGRRRIDRILNEEFAKDLEQLAMDELRARRKDAEQEETDLSYLRRLIQGRVDIVQGEIERRGGAEQKGLVEQLTGILSENGSRHAHGSGRYSTVEPSRMDDRRRRVEKAIADVDISNASARTDAELVETITRLKAMEAEVSRDRRLVQNVMDACTAEIGRRYREGSAHVEDLLQPR